MYPLAIFVLFPILVWVASLSINGGLHGDDGLYGFQDMIWATTYRIVPGLGNLHGRFAFNISHTLFLSQIETLPFLPPVRHITHGLLLVAFSLQVIWSGIQIFSRGAVSLVPYFYLLIFPLVLFVSRDTPIPYLASIKNDYVIFLVSMVIAGNILELLETRCKPDIATIASLSLIAFASITTKMSIVIFAGSLLLILLYRSPMRTLLVSVPIGVAIVGVA